MPSFSDAVAAFQNGDVNTISELPPDILQQVSALQQLTVYTAYRPSFGAVIYNWQRPEVNFFRDFRMRQALTRSIDRVSLVNKFMAGRAVSADSPVLPGSWAYTSDATCPGFDPSQPDLAKKSLSQVQILPTAVPDTATQQADQPPPAPSGPEFRFQLLVNNDTALANMAAEIVNKWNELGLKTNVVVVDAVTFKERLAAGNFDAALVELNLAPNADPDPYSLWRQVPADGGLNFGGMNDRRLSELVEQARREVNGIRRAELYKEFQRLFCERAAALLLYYPVYAYGADSRIEGIQLGFMSNPSDRFRTIQAWRFTRS
jgi:peptide/nickel transport system substrate-binding protein